MVSESKFALVLHDMTMNTKTMDTLQKLEVERQWKWGKWNGMGRNGEGGKVTEDIVRVLLISLCKRLFCRTRHWHSQGA